MNNPLIAWFFRFKDGLIVSLPLLIVAGVGLWLWGQTPLHELVSGRLLADTKLEYPVYADLDAHDNLYVIDRNSRRIVSLDAQGRLRWTLEGGQRSQGIYESYRLAAVPTGGLVAYNAVLDPVDATLEAEEILLFDDQGHFLETLVHKFYPKDQRGQDDQRIGNLAVRDGFLYYYYKDEAGTALLRRPLTGLHQPEDPATHERVFTTKIPVDWVSAAATTDGFYLATRTGGLVFLHRDGVVSQPAFSLVGGQPAFAKPWDLKTGPDGSLYLLDNYRQAVYRAPIGQTVANLVFDAPQVLALGERRPSFEAIAVGASGSLAVVDKFNHLVFLVHDGAKTRAIGGGTKTPRQWLAGLAWAGLDLLFLPLGLLVAVGLARRIFVRRTSLIVKQIAIFLPLVIVSVTLGSVGIFQLLDASYRQELQTKLALMANLGSRLIDGDLVDQIRQAADFDGPAHRQLGDQVNRVMDGYKNSWTANLRAVVYKYADDQLYFVKNYSSYYGVMFPYGGASRAHLAAARGGTVETTIYSDEYGSYLGGVAPLRGRDGHIAGVLEIYHNFSTVEELAGDFTRKLVAGLILSVLAVIVVLGVANLLLFLSLSFLSQASRRLSQGEVGLVVKTHRRDEIGDLAQDFNSMSGQLKQHFSRLQDIRDANARFVPAEFLAFLKKDSIADVESGDQTRHQMTLFFADIRGFTSISEGLTPKQNFDFVNSYLSLMGPVIRDHGGFIDRYLGDAIMALFPGSPADAVRAGLAMRERLVGFNQQREAGGLAPINFGVGVHTESIILGVVGEANRLSVTVISEAVDLVNQLEAATKTYHVGLVMTETVWQELPDELQTASRALDQLPHGDLTLKVYGL